MSKYILIQQAWMLYLHLGLKAKSPMQPRKKVAKLKRLAIRAGARYARRLQAYNFKALS